jgi:hypothetical protein
MPRYSGRKRKAYAVYYEHLRAAIDPQLGEAGVPKH